MKRIVTTNGKNKAVFTKDKFAIDGIRYQYKKNSILIGKRSRKSKVTLIRAEGRTFEITNSEARQLNRKVNGVNKKRIIIIELVAILLVTTVLFGGRISNSEAKNSTNLNNEMETFIGTANDYINHELKTKQYENKQEIEKQYNELEKKSKKEEEKRKEKEEKKEAEQNQETNQGDTIVNGADKEQTYKYQKSVAEKIENSEEYKAVQGKFKWNGSVINKSNGVVMGPHGRETYYNLPMGGVISIMRGLGNRDKYWIRSDGCKMLGNYIMVAAKVDATHKRGRIIKCSRGFAIVCDTGSFLSKYPNGVDVAVNW